MYYRYSIETGISRIKTKLRKSTERFSLLFATAVTGLAFALAPAGAAPSAIYNNIPNPQPGNLPSEAFEAQTVSEFGGQVQLAGTVRTNPTVTVLMSSWGCQTGHWYSGDCATTPGSTFSVPVTLNVYNVGANNAPGSLVTSQTQTFNIPYRPSASSTCGDGRWSDGTTCYNGFATPISFNLTGVTLPNNAIISVAYNTTHYGYSPIGEQAPCFSSASGCGYDSLNVAVTAPPTVGSDPLPSDAYLNAQIVNPNAGYCSPGAVNTFRLDTGCWTGNQPAIRVDVNLPNKDDCKNNGWKSMTNPGPFKNQGDCVSYFATNGKNLPNGQ